MLAVARGIMSEPKVLMIDELSLGLAPVLVLSLFQTLLQLKELGITLMLVEQNIQMALAVSDYGYVLSQGRIDCGPARVIKERTRAPLMRFIIHTTKSARTVRTKQIRRTLCSLAVA
jgi:ABC-type branched-subunit amino acid transport system ATPase component